MTVTAELGAMSQAAQNILKQGYTIVKLSDFDSNNLHRAISNATKFFQRPLEEKLAHSSSDHNYGFRPFGLEYGITPDRPDMNESFNFWSDRVDLIPNAKAIQELMNSCLGWRDSLAPLVKDIIDEIAKLFGADAGPPFKKAAYLQINHWFQTSLERDLLQDKHEDANMLTVLYANAPGLEIYIKSDNNLETVLPILPSRNEILIMAGSALTALSGGAIKPLYHHVRNHCLDNRQSIMYFVNPELDEPLYSWAESAERVDIREYVQNAPLMFGLPRVEAL
jgi:isopenicillin N synthase-like dioxygenase